MIGPKEEEWRGGGVASGWGVVWEMRDEEGGVGTRVRTRAGIKAAVTAATDRYHHENTRCHNKYIYSAVDGLVMARGTVMKKKLPELTNILDQYEVLFKSTLQNRKTRSGGRKTSVFFLPWNTTHRGLLGQITYPSFFCLSLFLHHFLVPNHSNYLVRSWTINLIFGSCLNLTFP